MAVRRHSGVAAFPSGRDWRTLRVRCIRAHAVLIIASMAMPRSGALPPCGLPPCALRSGTLPPCALPPWALRSAGLPPSARPPCALPRCTLMTPSMANSMLDEYA